MKRIPVLSGFWRESARGLRLFFLNAYVAVPLLLFILHIRMWTLGLLVATIVTMVVIERFGFTVPVAILFVRAALAGRLVKRRRSCFGKALDR
jgi:intracellular multiplication protein IcmT